MEPRVIYDADDIVVLDKPSGLLTHPVRGPEGAQGKPTSNGTHPTARGEAESVVSWLLARYPDVTGVGDPSTGSGHELLRPGIVHRLDKETSGLLVVAKTQGAYEELKRLFHDRKVQKHYYALVWGVPRLNQGTIEKEIAAHNGKRRTVEVWSQVESAKTRPATTAWKLIEAFGDSMALLDVAPKTGRTHQIRVHMASIGHPLVCDPLYGGKRECPAELGRLFLHAFSLHIPREKELLEVDIPLAPELEAFCGLLRANPDNLPF